MNQSSAINVVWLKKDVRSHDHGALSSALQKQRDFIILYIYEPDQLSHPTIHGSHVNFTNEGLVDLEHRLSKIKQPTKNASCITIAKGEATQVLSFIHNIRPIQELLAHQETGHWISFQRDDRVRKWCQTNNIQFHEYLNGAIFRNFSNRNNYDKRASQYFNAPLYPSLDHFHNSLQKYLQLDVISSCGIIPANDLEFVSRKHCHDRPSRQKGGETEALLILNSFFSTRALGYASGISSPLTSWNSCSRISPHLTYGNVSLRYFVQQIRKTEESIRGDPHFPDRKKWLFSLSSLRSRLHWRSHFIQKLESEPVLEHHAVCRAYDSVRTLPNDFNPVYYKAWCEGTTGFPLVDACMRCLLKHGWVNFRMRAMLVSFACYNLWLDWRRIDGHLARCFLDFEPGIHFPQLQMQAGVTGINAMRVYNVTKQAKDQDKYGHFIRKYIPELTKVPTMYIHEPSLMPMNMQLKLGVIIVSDHLESGTDYDPSVQSYPSPIVNEKESATKSKKIIADIKRKQETKTEAKAVYIKHGSRRRNMDENMVERNTSKKIKKDGVGSNQQTLSSIFSSSKSSSGKQCNLMNQELQKVTIPRTNGANLRVIKKKEPPSFFRGISAPTESWTCKICTFINEKPLAPVCEVCGSERDTESKALRS